MKTMNKLSQPSKFDFVFCQSRAFRDYTLLYVLRTGASKHVFIPVRHNKRNKEFWHTPPTQQILKSSSSKRPFFDLFRKINLVQVGIIFPTKCILRKMRFSQQNSKMFKS